MISARFRNIVLAHYRAHGRKHLPWRRTRDPYRILVSEVMLQQTQVERVIAYYEAWMVRFPTAHALAKAPLSEVLTAWQGLGYNRRAKNLHAAAKALAALPRFPKTPGELEALPGIGPYTARAVAAFAYNQDVVFVETNIRTAVIHHFFRGKNDTIYGIVSDSEIREILEKALPRGKAREWYSALMDYGAHLKRSGVRLNGRTKGYVKQGAFAGSARQARGAILRELAKGPATKARLLGLLGDDRREQLQTQLAVLQKEGLVKRSDGGFCLPT